MKQHMAYSKIKNMIKKNKNSSRRHFNPNYTNRKERQEIIAEWIKPICDTLELTLKTFHLTLSIIDFVTSLFYFDPKNFRNISLVSLCLASKIYENRAKSMNHQTFAEFIQEERIDFYKIEKSVLLCLDFNLNILSPHDFLLQFLADPRINFEIQKNQREDFKIYNFNLAVECSCRYEMNKFNSIGVALSIFMVARKKFNCKRIFPKVLKKITKLNKRVLSPCFEQVLAISKQLNDKPVNNSLILGKNYF